jgi:hypothetical protein
MPSDDPQDYKTGYKKPPVASRSRKGNNINPRSHPRGSKVLAALLQQALDETAAAAEDNGQGRRQSKREVVIRRLVEKSAGADLAATKLLFELLRRADPNAVSADPGDAAPVGEDALALLKQRLARLARAQQPNPSNPAPTRSDPAARLAADMPDAPEPSDRDSGQRGDSISDSK